ncbi:MAG TPA: Ig-like domain-containing protein [Gemmatimonadales bacterium]|nr:Ig-like domain-containing protein [Gemmatimonadales bacterium]
MMRVVVAIALAGMTLGCSDGAGPRDSGGLLPPTPFVVSNPVPGPAMSASRARLSSTSATAGTSLVYVSLSPGKIPGATAATIADPRTSSGVTVPVVDGGFDPVGVTAAAGDTLGVLVRSETALSSSYRILVNLNVSPSVVRTNPPSNKRDVSLNPAITVVFSEPMDSASLIDAVTLTDGGSPVPGTVVIPANTGDILQVTFVPADPLAVGTTYVLQVGTAARDRDGQALGALLTSRFTTDTLPPDVTAPLVTILRPVAGDSEAFEYPSFRAAITEDREIADIEWEFDDRSGDAPLRVRFGRSNWGSAGYLDMRYILPSASNFHLLRQPHPGTYTVRMTVADESGNSGTSAPLTLTFAAPDSQPRIVVRSFTVIEFENPLGSAFWNYAPQLVVADAPGESGLEIVGFQMLTIPGLTYGNSWWNLTARFLSVPPGKDVPLFPERFGHYVAAVWPYSYTEGLRSSGGEATARLTYRDEAGHFYATTLKGPIVPGADPQSWTDGCNHWSLWGTWPEDLLPPGRSEENCRILDGTGP